jgi:membrane dipeptidase
MSSTPTKTKIQKLIIGLLILLLIIYILARIFVPAIIDQRFNTVINPSPYAVSEKATELYQSLEFVSDLHSDVLLWDRDISIKHHYGHEDIPRMIEANMALQAFTIVNKVPQELNFDRNSSESDKLTLPFIIQGRPIASWFDLTQRVVVQSQSLHQFSQQSNGKLTVIKTSQDLSKYLVARKNDKQITAGFLGIEGAQALKGDLDNLEIVYQAGVRMIGLTHFFDNEVGGSAHGIKKGGLTEFGKNLINAMEVRHVFVDLSHASPKLIDDVLAIATKPILISHSGVKGTCDNLRNLSDKHLKGIAKTGGVVGIAMFKQAICGTQAKDIAKAIKYTVDLIGAEHVGLGSDFDGAIASVFDVTGLPQIVDELLKLNMPEADIELIMGENIKRVLLKHLPKNSQK